MDNYIAYSKEERENILRSILNKVNTENYTMIYDYYTKIYSLY